MNKILAIDPSADGTTGYFLIDELKAKSEFREFKSKSLTSHFAYLNQLVNSYQPQLIVYEDIQHINHISSNTGALFKFLGMIESLKSSFAFVKSINKVFASQVKSRKKKIFANQEQIKDLLYLVGKGWFYQEQKISVHQLDAFLVYYLWLRK